MADFFLSNIFRAPHKCWPVKRMELNSMPNLESLRQSEWCYEFDRLAQNKMIQAAFRYGLFDKNNTYDFIEAMKNKIKRYEQTHNLELLIDIRNYAMLEFKKPKYDDAYYNCEDDTEHAPVKTI